MRITDIHVAEAIGPFGWCLVRLTTDAGLIGYGEAPLGTLVAPDELALARTALAGQAPLAGEALLTRLPWRVGFGLRYGLEIALLDLVGQQAGLPVYALLGAKYRDRIRLYVDSHAGIDWDPVGYAERQAAVARSGAFLEVYRPAAFAQHAREVVAQGYTAVKFDIDFPTPSRFDAHDRSIGPAELRGIIDAVAAVREAIGPEIDLAIDCHARYQTADALRIAYEVEPFRLLWLEDPVPPDNIAALAKVTAKARVPICTGEALQGLAGFRELLSQQAADIIQPDTPRAGGLREIQRIANLAESYFISVAPHNMTSPVGTLAAVHLCAALPNLLALEFHCNSIPWWGDIVTTPRPIIEQGFIRVPDAPGLGLVLDEAVLAQHTTQASLWQ
jgi:galactonate dehydratase